MSISTRLKCVTSKYTGSASSSKRLPAWPWLAAASTLLAACGGLSPVDPTLVTVDTGIVQGAQAEGVLSYKGIPFAAPPVGDLRWRPPQQPATWTGVRPAAAFGHDCMQPAFGSNPQVATPTSSEDCLVLNVWRPATEVPSRERLPVMVYIHGGGYIAGAGSDPSIEGSEFARQGVVLITLNYRLGRFGFFAHPALSAEQPDALLGNYGYMDQIAALKWVQRNIAAFGGDPANVTVFGESAGGESIHSLLTTPLAKGLFQKAIVQSGNGRENQVYGLYLKRNSKGIGASAEEIGVAFAQSVGIGDTGAGGLAALRALPAATVLANAALGSTYAGGPMIEGKMVIDEPAVQYAKGQFNQAAIMIGSTDRDLDLGFPGPAQTKDEAYAIFGPQNLEAARAAFDPQGTATVAAVRSQMGIVQLMHEPARFVAATYAAQGQPAYVYRFAYVAQSIPDRSIGAVHAAEIPYVFGTLPSAYGTAVTSQDTAVARLMTGYWAQFAKSGNPNGGGRPDWPAYSASKNGLIQFHLDGTASAAQPDPLKAQLDLIQAVGDRKVTR